MAQVIIENIVNIIGALLMTAIGVLGAWLTAKLGKRAEVATINAAQQEVISMAQITVGELQQTVVEGLKAASEDGKLTDIEIVRLGEQLIRMTIDKMSLSTYNLLNSAGVDIIALIRGVGEDWVNTIKGGM